MKRILPALLLITSLAIISCSSSKNYLERSNEDKALQDAIKKLNKSTTDEKALEAIPILYSNIKLAHLAKIKSFGNSTELSRWDKIIREYEYLQDAYDAIINSSPSFKLVNPENYSTQLLETRQAAAEEYYAFAQKEFEMTGRDNARIAFLHYQKAEKYIPGFKDAQAKMDQAYENAIVNVVINRVQDNSFFYNSGWGNGYNYSNEYFQNTLVRELNNNNNRYAARFYTDWEERRDNIKPDWNIDLRLRNMDIPQPISYQYSRNVSERVQVGTDTAGKPVYNTVYATLYITRMSFNARADMELIIRDLAEGKNILYRNFNETYRWEEERATYNGDSRALSNRDWQMINGSGYNTPRKEDVLNELYRKIYPQVKSNIIRSVEW
jgi:hypothetical protein